MNYLQPYKGKSTRHTCPSCGRKHSFTLYLSGQTHEPINWKVGKCNREIKCGYHYPPKQYFIDNPCLVETWHDASRKSKNRTPPISSSPSHSGEGFRVRSGTIPCHFLKNSLSLESNFVSFLQNHFTEEQINNVCAKYFVGATKRNEVIFWQVDIQGQIRTGKIMQYDSETGKRFRHSYGAIDWVHNKLKKSGQLSKDFNLQQCFFGEHLLKIYPEKPVAIVESEKSAIIASCTVPDMIWLAAGSLNGLTIEKCHALKGRNIILYPDLGAFEKWNVEAQTINSLFPSIYGQGAKVRCSISKLLENKATDTDCINGLDIADFIIIELKSRKEILSIQSDYSPVH